MSEFLASTEWTALCVVLGVLALAYLPALAGASRGPAAAFWWLLLAANVIVLPFNVHDLAVAVGVL